MNKRHNIYWMPREIAHNLKEERQLWGSFDSEEEAFHEMFQCWEVLGKDEEWEYILNE